MVDTSSLNSRWAPRVLSVLRVVAAVLFIQHGARKLYGFLAAQPGPAPELFSTMWIAGVLEVFGGLIFLLGLFTRQVAFILSGLMAAAYCLTLGGSKPSPLGDGFSRFCCCAKVAA